MKPCLEKTKIKDRKIVLFDFDFIVLFFNITEAQFNIVQLRPAHHDSSFTLEWPLHGLKVVIVVQD